MNKKKINQMQLRISKIQLSILKRALFLFFENKDYLAMCSDCQNELIELVNQIATETERDLKRKNHLRNLLNGKGGDDCERL